MYRERGEGAFFLVKVIQRMKSPYLSVLMCVHSCFSFVVFYKHARTTSDEMGQPGAPGKIPRQPRTSGTTWDKALAAMRQHTLSIAEIYITTFDKHDSEKIGIMSFVGNTFQCMD